MVSKRIEPKLEAQIERWLGTWSAGQYGTRLTWEKLSVYAGFSRQSLSANRKIAKAYKNAKLAIARGFQRPDAAVVRDSRDDRVDKLEEEVRVLKEQALGWAALWERWRYNARQQGWDVTLLEREIPKPSQRKRPPH